jgi:type VI secretion system protein ImpM
MAVGFGKIPSEGDFVRYRVEGGPVEFERWVERGIMAAHGRWGQSFQPAFDAGAPHAFVYRAGTEELLIGVVAPSRDTVGRRYPFVVCERVVSAYVRGAPHLLLLASGDFLEAASALVQNLAGHDKNTLGIELASLPPPNLGSLAAVGAEYTDWSMRTPVETAFGVTFSEPQAHAAYAIDVIFQCVHGWRGSENPQTPLSVRLPLGAGGPAAGAFWLDVVRRISRWQATVPSHFWRWNGDDGALLVQLGETPPSSLPELWLPDPDSSVVCELTGPLRVPTGSSLPQTAPAAAHVLATPSAYVSHLLDALWQ